MVVIFVSQYYVFVGIDVQYSVGVLFQFLYLVVVVIVGDVDQYDFVDYFFYFGVV